VARPLEFSRFAPSGGGQTARGAPRLIHVPLALLLLWWQPIGMALRGRVLFSLKLFGLGAVAVSLAHKAAQPRQGEGGPARQARDAGLRPQRATVAAV